MAIEHEVLGLIADAEEGPIWGERLAVGDQDVDVELHAVPGRPLGDGDGVSFAAAFLAALEGADLRAREFLVAGLGSAGEVQLFVTAVLDELGDGLEDVLSYDSGDREIDLLRSLLLERVIVYPALDGPEEAFVRMIFAVDADEVDPLVVVSMTRTADLAGVEILD